MSNFTVFSSRILLGLALVAPTSMAARAPSPEQVAQMLQRADNYRLKEDAARVISLVSLYQAGELDKTREYHVYTRSNRESLVIFKSAVEAGQKMLMLQDNYWLQMPKSRRPIRITPMQKLLGEASVGDISTLTWSDDYQGQWQAQETLTLPDGQSLNTHKLALTALTSGSSYQHIDLWIAQKDDFPIKADLYLRSGKLAKQAWFERGVQQGVSRVVSMTLLDSIQPAKKTVIEYQDIQPWALEDKFYNPSYLIKADVSQW